MSKTVVNTDDLTWCPTCNDLIENECTTCVKATEAERVLHTKQRMTPFSRQKCDEKVVFEKKHHDVVFSRDGSVSQNRQLSLYDRCKITVVLHTNVKVETASLEAAYQVCKSDYLLECDPTSLLFESRSVLERRAYYISLLQSDNLYTGHHPSRCRQVGSRAGMKIYGLKLDKRKWRVHRMAIMVNLLRQKLKSTPSIAFSVQKRDQLCQIKCVDSEKHRVRYWSYGDQNQNTASTSNMLAHAWCHVLFGTELPVSQPRMVQRKINMYMCE